VPNDLSTPPATPPPSAGGGWFLTTQWTQVTQAAGSSAESRAALSDLCARYWTPVNRFILRERRDPDASRDLTQEFFSRLLAGSGVAGAARQHGRFRTYLLGAVKHFLADERDRKLAAKRGSGLQPMSLSAPGSDSSSGLQIPDPAAAPDDTRFDRDWALLLLDRSCAALASEWAAAGRARDFEILKPWLVGDTDSLSQAEAARQLGMREGAVKVAIHRLRKRLRELVRHDIAQTVSTPADIDDELRYFVRVLTGSGPC
jgi:DNA-directed RNA polymerase specialized sigma24 family protein